MVWSTTTRYHGTHPFTHVLIASLKIRIIKSTVSMTSHPNSSAIKAVDIGQTFSKIPLPNCVWAPCPKLSFIDSQICYLRSISIHKPYCLLIADLFDAIFAGPPRSPKDVAITPSFQSWPAIGATLTMTEIDVGKHSTIIGRIFRSMK